jgi:hypothetical protein
MDDGGRNTIMGGVGVDSTSPRYSYQEGAGTVASTLMAPLDRVKPQLQTQRMDMVLPSLYYQYNNNNVSRRVNISNGGNGGGGVHTMMAILEECALSAAQEIPMVCPKITMVDRRVLS